MTGYTELFESSHRSIPSQPAGESSRSVDRTVVLANRQYITLLSPRSNRREMNVYSLVLECGAVCCLYEGFEHIVEEH